MGKLPMRSSKLRAIGRLHFGEFAPLYRLRRRAVREDDFDIFESEDAGNIASDMGIAETDYAMVIGIFPGFGSYWECQIVVKGNQQEIRSYKLGSLVGEVIKVLWEYE